MGFISNVDKVNELMRIHNVKTLKELANVMGASYGTTKRWSSGFPIYTAENRYIGCKYNDGLAVKKMIKDVHLAEFFGVLLGDGCLTGYTMDITLNRREMFYIDYVKKLCERVTGLKPKVYPRANVFHLRIHRKKLIFRLTNLGLKMGNKVKNNVGIPDWIKKRRAFQKVCLRGLFDTDGCVYRRSEKYKLVYMSFSNHSSQLLIDVFELLTLLNIHSTKQPDRVTIYKQESVEKFERDIGFKNKKHLDRISFFRGG